MGCCYSNEEYETSHYGYKNLTNEITNQKRLNQSNNVNSSNKKAARLFKISPLPTIPKNVNNSNKLNEKKGIRHLKPTIYFIKLKTSSSNVAKYTNNVNQSSFIKDDSKCNCTCINCKKHQSQSIDIKKSSGPNLASRIKAKRNDLKAIRSSQVLINNDVVDIDENASINFKEKFNIEALNQHNKYRRSHGVPPLELNQNLVKLAQKHSDFLAITYRHVYSDAKYNGQEIGQNIKMYADSRLDYYSGKIAYQARNYFLQIIIYIFCYIMLFENR